MDHSWELPILLAIWLAAAMLAVMVRGRRDTGRAGLMLAYVAHVWLIHWLSASLYVIPWYSNLDPEVVEEGFRQSTYALAGLCVGAAGVARLFTRVFSGVVRKREWHAGGSRPAFAYVATGCVAYLLLLSALERVPTLTALVGAMSGLTTAGLSLGCWLAWRGGRYRALLGWLGATAVVPLFTILSAGFLSYGAAVVLAVFSLLGSAVRWRPRAVLAGLALGYLGLSFYVTYMRDRDNIRSAVWGGEGTIARAAQLYETLSTLEWFDLGQVDLLARIDDRLNQNFLVGMAVFQLESGFQDYAWGGTLWQAVLGLVPRAVWPGKPVVAGSMGLVSVYTGIHFAEGTSVGLGQVLEFYINFGALGVFIGFVVLGAAIALVDMAAGACLARGDWRAFTLWYLPGLALLQAGGSLVEMTSSAAAAAIMAVLVNRFVLPRLSGARRSPYRGASEEGVRPRAWRPHGG